MGGAHWPCLCLIGRISKSLQDTWAAGVSCPFPPLGRSQGIRTVTYSLEAIGPPELSCGPWGGGGDFFGLCPDSEAQSPAGKFPC
jgi:hypothetical protein